MNGILAVALLTAFLVLFRVCYTVFRGPNPPAWTQGGLGPELVCVGLVGLLATGLTFLLKEIGQILAHGVTRWDLAALAAAVLVIAMVWRLAPRPRPA
jgi:hypothetical protein